MNQQSRQHQQHQRQRDFRSNEDVPETSVNAARSRGPRRILQITGDISARAAQRRDEPGGNPSNECDRKSKQEDCRIERNATGWKDLLGARRACDEHVREPQGEQRTHGSAGQTEYYALGDQLPDDAAAAGAERGANANLPRPRHGARQDQVRDVQARDEQDAQNRAKQYEQGPANVADQIS